MAKATMVGNSQAADLDSLPERERLPDGLAGSEVGMQMVFLPDEVVLLCEEMNRRLGGSIGLAQMVSLGLRELLGRIEREQLESRDQAWATPGVDWHRVNPVEYESGSGRHKVVCRDGLMWRAYRDGERVGSKYGELAEAKWAAVNAMP